MKKVILRIEGVNELSKKSQKEIQGGMLTISDCPSGCFRFFFGGPGNRCIVPSPSGAACEGIVTNGQCCL